MFKKLVTYFKKFEKIVGVLIKVERGFIVCKTCIEAIMDGLKANSATYKTLGNVLKYLDSGIEAVGTLLDWFGRKDDVCEAQPKGLAEEELLQIAADIREAVAE